MINMSYSRVSSYRGCPYKHYLSYVENLESNKPVRALSFGTDIHRLLELKDRPKKLEKAQKKIADTYYSMPPQFQSELGGDYLENVSDIFEDYLLVHSNAVIPDETELKFEIPFAEVNGETLIFKGVIDEVYPKALGEHKTFSQKPDMIHLAMNTQSCLYAKALRKLKGKTPKRVIWDFIKSTPASAPVYLESSKRLSAAKSNNITPMSWKRACKTHGITDPKIIALGDAYEQNISGFFFKVTLDINRDMVNKIWDDFKLTAIEIANKGSENKIQNVTRDCTWCSFKDICYTQFTGGDVAYTIEKNYRQKLPR